MSDAPVTHLKRPSLPRTKPQRGPGGAFRTNDNLKTGLGGVPLTTVEDATVAAVRMAYDIASAQIDRSKRLADRLKGAADRGLGNDPTAGQKSAEDAVDGASRLVNNAMLSGMALVEALMAGDNGLAPRLAAAQLKAVKEVLFNVRDTRDDSRTQTRQSTRPEAAAPPAEGSRSVSAPVVRIMLRDKPDARRAVTILRWDVNGPVDAKLVFRPVDGAARGRLYAGLERAMAPDHGRATLVMDPMDAAVPAGRWRAAVCSEDGEQHGIVEIEI
jgi:hypothetical protein